MVHKVTSLFSKLGVYVAVALALACIVSALVASARAADFSHEQCRIIAAVTAEVVRAIGADTLSVEFRTSLRDFIMTEGDMTCGGPKDILTPTTDDVAAFNTIRSQLLGGPNPISLQKSGVRSVASRVPN